MIDTAANSKLIGGGGADAAVHKAAGPNLLKALKKFNGCDSGDAVITKAFNLNAKYVIHAVGPIYEGGGNQEEELLYSAYKKSIKLSKSVGARTVLFPAISTGVYGYPMKEAAKIAVEALNLSCQHYDYTGEVSMVCFDNESFSVFKALLNC